MENLNNIVLIDRNKMLEKSGKKRKDIVFIVKDIDRKKCCFWLEVLVSFVMMNWEVRLEILFIDIKSDVIFLESFVFVFLIGRNRKGIL